MFLLLFITNPSKLYHGYCLTLYVHWGGWYAKIAYCYSSSIANRLSYVYFTCDVLWTI